MLEQCGQIKAALESPAGCERVGNYEKALEASCQSQAKAVSTKLPKLSITKFDGKYENWLPFWNKLMAEIDRTDISPVTKFAYVKELVE